MRRERGFKTGAMLVAMLLGWAVAGMAAEKACFLFTNGGNSCIHTCPYFGQVKPGQTKTTLSRIYILQGDPATLQRRYQRDFLQG